MTFFEFSKSLQKLEETPSRLEMTYQLADLFTKLSTKASGQEIVLASYIMQGKLVPPYESQEFNLSVKMVQRALAKFTSGDHQDGQMTDLFGDVKDDASKLKEVVKKYKQLGDLGLVVEEILKDNKVEKHLSIQEVYDKLFKIAQDGGAGSQERKVDALVDLLKDSESISAKFIIRLIIGKLRLGFSTMTMIDALSWAKNKDKSESKDLELAYQKKADLGKLAQLYLAFDNKKERLAHLINLSVEAGVPVVPALCQRLNSSEEIIQKMGEVYAEPKFDGLRVQIHFIRGKDGVKIKAFTRNLEDVSHMFPELDQAASILKCDSCVLDSEAIGFDPKTGKLVEFQKTMKRKRKHDIEETAKEVPMRFYVFDVLEIDNKSIIANPLRDRKDLLNRLFSKNEVFFQTEYIVTSDIDILRSFHEQQLKDGLEGAVMKKSDSVYISGRKGWSWVKIKEEEGNQGKLSDTLDLVVMGYYAGRGKRSQFGIGAVLAGVLDKNENIKTIAKIGTGLTEDQLVLMKKVCDENKSNEKPNGYEVHKNLIPDVWVKPEVVIEVAADELTKSPTHSAGVALRFPRMLKFRDDKSLEQITKKSELSSISHLK
ncbi:MAG: ATP-dependent DNA ligase [Candidatus Pacebacteria bacterium]|nr:ATP-dependent DNA ligase [Candidatus Paceibacterota bacterium]